MLKYSGTKFFFFFFFTSDEHFLKLGHCFELFH